MPIEDFIITVYCCVEEIFSKVINNQTLCHKGRQSKLTDSEIIAMEIVGEFIVTPLNP